METEVGYINLPSNKICLKENINCRQLAQVIENADLKNQLLKNEIVKLLLASYTIQKYIRPWDEKFTQSSFRREVISCIKNILFPQSSNNAIEIIKFDYYRMFEDLYHNSRVFYKLSICGNAILIILSLYYKKTKILMLPFCYWMLSAIYFHIKLDNAYMQFTKVTGNFNG